MRTLHFLDPAVACYTASIIDSHGFAVKWTKDKPKMLQTDMPNEKFRTLMNNITIFGQKEKHWHNFPDINKPVSK